MCQRSSLTKWTVSIHKLCMIMCAYTCTCFGLHAMATALCVKDGSSSQCVSVRTLWELSPPPSLPPSLSFLSLILSSSFLPHSFLCHPSFPRYNKRRERPVHSCIQAVSWAKERQREEWEGERKWDGRREDALPVLKRSPVLHHRWR